MASNECTLLKQGKSKKEAGRLTREKYSEYNDLILEYGVDAYVRELFEQCPEFFTGSGGGSNSSSDNSECSINSSEIYDISRGRKVTKTGNNCSTSFN
ncbi:hypothetical protein N9N71_01695 [Synechococcus sp. AH-229-G18]|nr:hypothetical protein [Synechococcus sp. AH-229-G18]